MLRGALVGRCGLRICVWRTLNFNSSSVRSFQLFLLTLSMLFDLSEVQFIICEVHRGRSGEGYKMLGFLQLKLFLYHIFTVVATQGHDPWAHTT